jgi:transcriptional regulator with XRE-family HTH domain
MKPQGKAGYDQFVEAPSKRRLLEQESLILEAAELLSMLMASEGVTKTELARRLGRSKAYLTQVLRGTTNLTLRTLADLGLAIGYRLRFQAKNIASGCLVSLPDVPHLYSTPQGHSFACWRAFDQPMRGGIELELYEGQPAEILPLSA